MKPGWICLTVKCYKWEQWLLERPLFPWEKHKEFFVTLFDRNILFIYLLLKVKKKKKFERLNAFLQLKVKSNMRDYTRKLCCHFIYLQNTFMKTTEQLYAFYEEGITTVFLKLKPNSRKLDNKENCQNTRIFGKALPLMNSFVLNLCFLTFLTA